MYVYCVRKLGLDHEKVNVNGGAIALGHPLDEFFTYPSPYGSTSLAFRLFLHALLVPDKWLPG